MIKNISLLAACALLAILAARAQADAGDALFDYSASLTGTAASGKFAPSLISSLRHGKIAQPGIFLDAMAQREMDASQRFSWGAAAEVIGNCSGRIAYERYSPASGWTTHKLGMPGAWIQQLYAEGKYRSVFLTVGMKEHGSALLNNSLTSGDLVESGNCRPIPEARVGFIDFQDIPFTNGWVQIQGEVSYGKMVDNGYLKDHYNYYNYHLTLGTLYTYKRCYFRTKPSQRLSVTVGMQVGGFFGGTVQYWENGAMYKQRKFDKSIKSVFKMLLPMGENGEDYYTGSSLGSWDMFARYSLRNGAEICAYFQWPWEDGSGIGRRNQWDGLWGLEYRANRQGLVNGAVLELFDFRDQSGPIHHHPDTPGFDIAEAMSGRDNYYNNGYYNSYANYGMAIGTPVLPSPCYNTDGYPAFACNRLSGAHLGISGCLAPTVRYRLLASLRRGLGTYENPYYKPLRCAAAMVEAQWDANALLPGISIKGQLAIDRGGLVGNNIGACISITYSGTILR